MAQLIGALFVTAALLVGPAYAQDDAGPAVGGVKSPPSAMIFYQAHGREGACGLNCSDWIAAEGTVEWDSYKRLFAFIARFGDRKMPIVENVWGSGDLNVAVTLGKIIREHGLDVRVGATILAACPKPADVASCIALKRSGTPADGRIDTTFVECDIVCLLILAGGVHRTLPADAVVVVNPMHIQNRLAPNVSDEQQRGLQAHYGDRFRLYLKQMGVSTEIVDLMEDGANTGRSVQVAPKDWSRFGIVTAPVQ